jgi:hypothetical protein
MPNNVDFSKLENINTVEINPNGWKPLTIEYGINNVFEYCWRIKGTTHTFTIPIIRLDFISSGNYGEHFKTVLETFREDYIKWKDEGFIYEWSREYRDQYSRYINI